MSILTKKNRFPIRAALAGALAVGLPASALTIPAQPAQAQSQDDLDRVVTALRAICLLYTSPSPRD